MGRVRFCENCGSPLSDGVRFCENCGASVPGVRPPRRRENWTPQGTRRMEEQAPVQRSRRMEEQAPVQRSRRMEEQAPAQRSRRIEGQAPVQRSRRMEEQAPVQRNRRMEEQAPVQRNRRMEEQQIRRYRQEELENDWQQSWDRMPREEEEQRITPVQYVLIGLTVVLLAVLIIFGVYWILGRSSNKSTDSRSTGQSGTVETKDLENESEPAVIILDGNTADPVAAIQNGNTALTSQQAETRAPEQAQTTAQSEAADIVMNYQEFSVTLPGSWKGKYGITQGANYYTYYQQASRARGCGGTLFTIAKYTDTSYKELSNGEVLGTGNGAAFVYQLPTDVDYVTDDAAIAQEYQTMAGDLDTIKNGIRLLVSGEGPAETEPPQVIEIQEQGQQTVSTGGYIPESSQRLINDGDVAGMSYNDMQMAINEIYARHGRKFADPDIQSYFDNQSWYQGTLEPDQFSESVFSSTESQNIQFLLGKMGVQ